MRILQAANSFKYGWSSGGVARVSYDVSLALTKYGHEVTVFTTEKGLEKGNEIINNKLMNLDGLEVYYFSNFSKKLAKKGVSIPLLSLFMIRTKIKEFNVIHIHEHRRLMNIFIYFYAQKFNVPYVLQAHGSLPLGTNIFKKILKWIYDVFFGYRLLRGASKVIALTQIEAEQYKYMGVPGDKIAIIPNGIDLSDYADLPSKGEFKKKFNISEDKKVILYLGRIHQSKGIDLLIKSFSLVLDRLKSGSTILVLIGPDDGYMDEAKSLVESESIFDSVFFTGFVSAEDKRKALVDADIFVTPSFSGFPITFLEACATGTPIITTTLGDNLEWIDGKAGYVTLPTSSDLSDAMFRLLVDDDLRRKLSENCIDVVKSDFVLEKVVDKLNQTYERVIISNKK